MEGMLIFASNQESPPHSGKLVAMCWFTPGKGVWVEDCVK
uniref:Uncharacterized protein n=1 Tax=Setaria italica TaxID=4555 RepID=K3YF27_SETIT